MKVIEWKDEFSVGVPLMDAHHQQFLNMVHELNQAVSSGREDVDKKAVLTFFIEYLDMHLRAEERLMESIDFSGANAHKEVHHEFENKILEIERAFEKDEALLKMEDLCELVQEWLIAHILSEDKKYEPYV
ncbi:MAG: bacteriohemerythrin [Candidatus Polarisedimenticolaceae bacterium]|nr:bacteriohemerythrin [Candidatus Polarisedimenticolaceae bacterium]